MKFRWQYAVAIVVILLLLAVGFLPKWKTRREVENTQSATPEAEVVQPRRVAADDLVLPGNLEPIEEAIINARASGYLKKRYVDIGTRVRKGQLLALVDSPELDRAVEQAQAEQARADAAARQALAEVSRYRAAVANARAGQARSVARYRQSQANLINAETAVTRAERAVRSQKGNVRAAQTRSQLADTSYRRWRALLDEKAVAPQEVDERRSARDEAEANVLTAHSQLTEAQATVLSAKAQYRAGEADVSASAADVDAANRTIEAAQADLSASAEAYTAALASADAARANLQRSRELQEFERVVAPFNGIITARETDTGALISATGTVTGLFRLARTDTLRIRVQVPQGFIPKVAYGTAAVLNIAEFPGSKFVAQVFRRSGGLEQASRTLQTELRLDNTSGRLLPGMYAQVHFAIKGLSALRVPSSAVMIDASGNRLGVVAEDGTIHYQNVEMGRDLGKETEIISGVEESDRVLTAPSYSLSDGVKVKAVSAKEKKNQEQSAPAERPATNHPSATPGASGTPAQS